MAFGSGIVVRALYECSQEMTRVHERLRAFIDDSSGAGSLDSVSKSVASGSMSIARESTSVYESLREFTSVYERFHAFIDVSGDAGASNQNQCV